MTTLPPTLLPPVSPIIRVLRKQVGSAGGLEVTCLATGFYPRHIELTMQKDSQPVPEQELIRGDILPNNDGTYQMRMSLSVSAEELRVGHRYTCRVKHVSLDNKLDISWGRTIWPSQRTLCCSTCLISLQYLISSLLNPIFLTVLINVNGCFCRLKAEAKHCTDLRHGRSSEHSPAPRHWHLHLEKEEEQCARMQQIWEEQRRDGKYQCC